MVFGLCLKTKQVMVYQLRHKTDGRMKTTWDVRQDLATSLTWKQVELRFFSLTSRLVDAWREWYKWHHREDYVEIKLRMRMNGSMRRAAS
jgi:hypothetical protein